MESPQVHQVCAYRREWKARELFRLEGGKTLAVLLSPQAMQETLWLLQCFFNKRNSECRQRANSGESEGERPVGGSLCALVFKYVFSE